jgi:uncharacterized protein YbaA (DUF1428 family)
MRGGGCQGRQVDVVGKWTSFPRRQVDVVSAQRKAEAGRNCGVSWITYKSRKHRDRVNTKVMKDPRLADMMDPKAMPFDAKRMIYGGFKVFVSA